MSVDTYLKGKNTSRYRRVEHEGLEFLVAPTLVAQARTINLDVRRSLIFWRSFQIEVVPREDHFHGPT